MSTARTIVFLNRFYWPDVAATAQMLTDLAEDLAAMGWKVTIVTSRSGYDAQEAVLPSEEWHNGVRIYRTSGTRFGRHTLVGRLADYVSYIAGAFVRLMRLEHQDAVVGLTDPPFIAGVAVLAARIRGWRSVYWVQDLFPHLAGELGVLPTGGLVYRLADRIGRWLNRSCDLVVALGPQMARRVIGAGARAERTTYVHNWTDSRAVFPVDPADNLFLAETGLVGKFVVLYSGNAGRAHRFESIMFAAAALQHEPDIVFVFIGGGKRYHELRAAAERDSLPNVRFLPYVSREGITYSLSSASIALVTEHEGVTGLLVPSKAYGILASGRPLVFIGSPDSDVAHIVRDAECGVVLGPDDATGLVDTIRALRNDSQRRALLGRNARRALETRFDRPFATARWARLVGSMLDGELPSQSTPPG